MLLQLHLQIVNIILCVCEGGRALALSLPKCADCALEVRLVVSPSYAALIKGFC